ncbi:MAG: hypothetical protein GY716_05585 [bacterium]|nr:hypothetical protein [bacterium]
MSDTPKQTVIEEGTEFDGSVNSKCDITLSGKVKGKLDAPSLTVTPSGVVDGQVTVETLCSKGQISGEILADTVELSGKVNDKTVINAATLEVKLSDPGSGLQVVFGNCELKVGQKAGKGEMQQQNKSEQKQPQPVGK